MSDRSAIVSAVPVIPPEVAKTLSLSAHPDAIHIGYWRNSEDGSRSYYLRELRSAEDSLKRISETGSCGYTSSEADRFGGDMRAMFEAKVVVLRRKHWTHESMPWPKEHCDRTMSWIDRDRTARLLEQVSVETHYCGYSWDRLNPENNLLGTGERTQAGYVWPEGLSYYVRAYGLVLPDPFSRALYKDRDV